MGWYDGKMEPFKVGDKVAIIYTGVWGKFADAPQEVRTVKKVLKPYLELDDGTRWKHEGHQHPYTHNYHSKHIEHFTEEHASIIKRKKLWYIIESRFEELRKKCEGITLEQLETLDKATFAALKSEE